MVWGGHVPTFWLLLYICIHIYIFICIYIYLCMHVYIDIYMHKDRCISILCIYIYIERERESILGVMCGPYWRATRLFGRSLDPSSYGACTLRCNANGRSQSYGPTTGLWMRSDCRRGCRCLRLGSTKPGAPRSPSQRVHVLLCDAVDDRNLT